LGDEEERRMLFQIIKRESNYSCRRKGVNIDHELSNSISLDLSRWEHDKNANW
jgi:hypothetical protein